MLKLNEMPTNIEEITTAWLSHVLQQSGALAETVVVDFTVEPLSGAGYIGLVARIKPIYDSSVAQGPSSLIFKYSSPDPDFRQGVQGFYAREVRVYQELSDQIELPMAHCYFSHFDPETGHSVVLMEDLAHLRQGDIAKGCDLADIKTVIIHLAHHHAQWWENPALKTIDYLPAMNSTTPEGQEWFQTLWAQYEDKLTETFPDCYLPAEFLKLGLQTFEQKMAIEAQMAKSPFTFVHKDTHLDNIMFAEQEDDNPVTFIDWQCCGYGPGVSDITYFIIFSVPVKLRRQAEHEILRSYHAELLAHGVTNYSFEQCWQDYRLAFFRNLFISVACASLVDLSRPHAQGFISAAIPRLMSFAEDHCVSEFLTK